MYTHDEGDTQLLLGVYVNDLIVAGAHALAVSAFKCEMCNRFDKSDLGLLTLYLSV